MSFVLNNCMEYIFIMEVCPKPGFYCNIDLYLMASGDSFNLPNRFKCTCFDIRRIS